MHTRKIILTKLSPSLPLSDDPSHPHCQCRPACLLLVQHIQSATNHVADVFQYWPHFTNLPNLSLRPPRHYRTSDLRAVYALLHNLTKVPLRQVSSLGGRIGDTFRQLFGSKKTRSHQKGWGDIRKSISVGRCDLISVLCKSLFKSECSNKT